MRFSSPTGTGKSAVACARSSPSVPVTTSACTPASSVEPAEAGRAGDEQPGGQGVGLRGARGDHGHRHRCARRPAGRGIQDVVVADAVDLQVALVVAGGDHGAALTGGADLQDRQRRLGRARMLYPDTPGALARLEPRDQQIAARLDQEPLDALPGQVVGDQVDHRTLAHAAQVHLLARRQGQGAGHPDRRVVHQRNGGLPAPRARAAAHRRRSRRAADRRRSPTAAPPAGWSGRRRLPCGPPPAPHRRARRAAAPRPRCRPAAYLSH